MSRSTFGQIRLALLSALLLLVLLYAWHDVQRRQERANWEQPLDVAIVLLSIGRAASDGAGGDPSLPLLRLRVNELEARLNSELQRYRPGGNGSINLSAFGPVDVQRAPPTPEGESLWDAAKHAYSLWRYTRAVDSAAQVPSRAFDSRIYVLAEPIADEGQKFVEGFSEQGGRVGVARVQLDTSTVDLALFVVAHELMHTLGASDKYRADGSAQLPEGLGDPDQTPLFPQLRAEVMARNRVIANGHEAVPDSLAELAVGAWTAREIGWINDAP